MKKLLLLLLLAVTSTVVCHAQSTINPDTVCFNTNGSVYSVTSTPGYTYTWTALAPGVIISGNGTNQITVDWSAAPSGLINNAISVYATTAAGCVSPTVTLNVFILQVIPIITPIGPFCQGAACVPLVATPIGGVFSGPGVVGNTFCPSSSGVGVFNVNYTVVQGGCTFTSTTSVTVTTLPSLSPISHN